MKAHYKVHEIAEKLHVKKHVIKIWEKEFGFENKNDKYYTKQDFETFQTIKKLLHEQKLSIKEAKNHLENIIPAAKTEEPQMQIAAQEIAASNQEITASAPQEEIVQESIENPMEEVSFKEEAQETILTNIDELQITMSKQEENFSQNIEETLEASQDIIPATEEKIKCLDRDEFYEELQQFKVKLLKFKELLN
ncbi:TPA: hypothetical protein DEO28_04495 [Candidatus Dependentiae bacterium]|nr:MAG: hypothetical protein UR14_C0002G0017 [candidate division TM6 bacterium GW2011_GWE2_31_21]KKP53814.1 MAG: hypothetical protein UR43_C0002G0017 [candidate division TM6 bacterium GW2011_GWF2_33_332]HBS47594.1 hypothetical protein [Candidatus Dependentiae bacterium]HBZ73743.1 hypothetical protein [Candidatus Dependentiae bacterium]